jgi:hypothetical protein
MAETNPTLNPDSRNRHKVLIYAAHTLLAISVVLVVASLTARDTSLCVSSTWEGRP